MKQRVAIPAGPASAVFNIDATHHAAAKKTSRQACCAERVSLARADLAAQLPLPDESDTVPVDLPFERYRTSKVGISIPYAMGVEEIGRAGGRRGSADELQEAAEPNRSHRGASSQRPSTTPRFTVAAGVLSATHACFQRVVGVFRRGTGCVCRL